MEVQREQWPRDGEEAYQRNLPRKTKLKKEQETAKWVKAENVSGHGNNRQEEPEVRKPSALPFPRAAGPKSVPLWWKQQTPDV